MVRHDSQPNGGPEVWARLPRRPLPTPAPKRIRKPKWSARLQAVREAQTAGRRVRDRCRPGLSSLKESRLRAPRSWFLVGCERPSAHRTEQRQCANREEGRAAGLGNRVDRETEVGGNLDRVS